MTAPDLIPLLTAGLAVAVLSTGAVGLTVALVHRDRRRGGPAFRRMAATLGLARTERRTIRRAARRAGVGAPAALLISRGCFEHAVERQSAVAASRMRSSEPRIFAAADDRAAPD